MWNEAKKNGGGGGGRQIGSNCPLVPLLNVIINCHLAYDTTIHLDAKFQLLGICCSRLYPKETITFFGSGLNWAHLGGSGCNTSSKELQIELIFWLQVVLIVVQMSFKAFWKTRISTETRRTQSLSFWSNFDHSLPHEDGRNQKWLSGYPNQSKWKPYLL